MAISVGVRNVVCVVVLSGNTQAVFFMSSFHRTPTGPSGIACTFAATTYLGEDRA